MRLVIAGAATASVAAMVVSGAIAWLCLTQPTVVADSLARGDAWALVAAATSVVMSALGHAIHRL